MKTKLNLKKLEPHPLGAMFPPMKDEEYSRMVRGLKKGGFDTHEKITILDGKILDGNNRYTGLRKAGISLHPDYFEDYKGDDPVGFVVMKNLSRRNLTPSQSAAIAAELVETWREMEKGSSEENGAANSQKNGQGRKLGGKSARRVKVKGSKTAKAAKALNVSERSVATATALKKVAPDLAQEVKAGKKTLHKAVKEAEEKLSAEQQRSLEYAEAKDRIVTELGEPFFATAEKKLSSQEVLAFSQLDKPEMKRIRPFIEAGWKLKAALGYKAQTLSYGHTLRQLRDRAIEQGGSYTLEMGDGWEITALNKQLTAAIPGL